MKAGRHFNADEDAYLMKAWRTGVSCREIAAHLNRSRHSITNRAWYLRVYRPEGFLSASRRAQRDSKTGLFVSEVQEEKPPGHRMTESAIAALYAGRRYESITTQDNSTGRVPLPQTFVASRNVLCGAA